MQYLNPLGLGPSLNTWPKCDLHFLHLTSILIIPKLLSVNSAIESSEIGSVKLGHPEPDSNFAFDENSGISQQTQ